MPRARIQCAHGEYKGHWVVDRHDRSGYPAGYVECKGGKEVWVDEPGAGPDGAADFWLTDILGDCWVCGDPTLWIYLDLNYQHPDCDAYPTEQGDVRIERGKVVVGDPGWGQ